MTMMGSIQLPALIDRANVTQFWLMVDGIRTGRTDGALVRLTTLIGPNEDAAAADARLMDMLREVMEPLPEFVPDE